MSGPEQDLRSWRARDDARRRGANRLVVPAKGRRVNPSAVEDLRRRSEFNVCIIFKP